MANRPKIGSDPTIDVSNIFSGINKDNDSAFLSGEDRFIFNQSAGWFDRGRSILKGKAKRELNIIADSIPKYFECHVLRKDRNRPEQCEGKDLILTFLIESHTQKQRY